MIEPKQEKRFDYKGCPCVVLFVPMGYRCGYVGIPKRDRYYGKFYDDIPVSCHCGLTYAKDYLHNQADKEIWWIGFDCGHCCDGYDIDKAKELYADDKNVIEYMEKMADFFRLYNAVNPPRTLEYCEQQCKEIVEQLIKLEKTRFDCGPEGSEAGGRVCAIYDV